MTFDKLALRCLHEYSEDNRIIELPSGARFWGELAIGPEPQNKISHNQSKDYGIDVSDYRKIGEGAQSLVYHNNEIIVKLSKSRQGYTMIGGDRKETNWRDILNGRIRQHNQLKKIESIPPFTIPQEGTFLSYSTYKFTGKKPIEGATYNKLYKGFGIFDEYKFSTAQSRILDSGIIVQQMIDTDLLKVRDRGLLMRIGSYIKEHTGHVDLRGISGNIFLDQNNKIIYVIDN